MFDVAAAAKHLRKHRILAEVVEAVGPFEFQPRRLPPFQSITQSIIHQQLSGNIAGIILNRFTALFGRQGFPQPEDVLDAGQDRLLSAGLSRAKASAIRDLAERTRAGLIPSLENCDTMPEEVLIETFSQVKGVGRWTVEMMLIFNLGRPDVLPVHDLGVRRGYQTAGRKRRIPTPEELTRIGGPWAPYRTAAALYLWRYLDR
jgi:3-methyladenine DNA glycosylase/8-oxoguanine DNA glycosylase